MKGTYNTVTNSFRERLSTRKVITRACILNASGGAVNESLIVAETDIIRWAARAQVGILQAWDSASYKENQVSVHRNKVRQGEVPGRD
jgi:hypothetical protein